MRRRNKRCCLHELAGRDLHDTFNGGLQVGLFIVIQNVLCRIECHEFGTVGRHQQLAAILPLAGLELAGAQGFFGQLRNNVVDDAHTMLHIGHVAPKVDFHQAAVAKHHCARFHIIHIASALAQLHIEQRIAEEYISTEQMNLFREECVVCGVEGLSLHPTPYTLHTEHGEVIRRLRSVVVAALQGNALNVPSLRDIVDFMRKHDAQFPEFRSL